MQDKEKHIEGNLQHDFACKHKSHDKFSVKKPVLVCNKHKDDKRLKIYYRNTIYVFLDNKTTYQHTANVINYPSISINELSKEIKALRKTMFKYFKISRLIRNAVLFFMIQAVVT